MQTKVSPEAAQTGLDRVRNSQAFRRTRRHRDLLQYLCEASISGKSGDVKEITIAADVFGRDGYDPQVDSQVRVEVAALRERLEKYYAGEGKEDDVRIAIPKGSYEPLFELRNGKVEPDRVNSPPGRSYRAAAVVTAVGAVAAAIVWFSRPAAVTPATPSLAILPFENLSSDRDQEYFCRGLAEELNSAVASLQIFRMIPWSLVAPFADRPRDLRRIRDQLNVHAVVEGTVRREANRLRISVRLIDAQAGKHLWSATYDREFGQVLDVQHEIAESIARAFNVDLKDTRHALVRQSTRNAEAYDHYLRAAYLFTNEPDRAVEFYKAAIAADPGYGLAWAGLSRAWTRLTDWYMVRVEEARPRALEAADRAMALSPGLAEAQHAWAAAKLYFERDWRAAEKGLRKAIDLEQTEGEHRWEYARLILLPMQRFAEAEQQMRAAIALQPSAVSHYNALANSHIKAGHYAEALPLLETSRKLSPGQPSAVVLQGIAAAGLGDSAAALARFQEAAQMRRSHWVLGYLGWALAKNGRAADARGVIAELRERGETGPLTDFERAVIELALGENDRAMAGLERAAAQFSHSLIYVKVDQRLDILRGVPRFEVLVKRLGL